MRHLFGVTCIIAIALLAQGCVLPLGRDPPVGADAVALAASASESSLQPGDQIRVTVFGEDKLSGAFDVDPQGAIALPLAGSVKAAGLSRSALEGLLSTKYKAHYLKDPKVTVDLISVRPFYIMGEVEKPGEYPFRTGLNVWRAMAIAGGQTYRASSTKVAIQRAGETGIKDYDLTADLAVHPGDLIRVPERYF